HYYCVLFSANLPQKGKSDEGIKGFLAEDIKKELRRGSLLKCSYCGKKGATVGCNVMACNKKFHMPCGLVNHSFHSFHHKSGSFPSFCNIHRPNQKLFKVKLKRNENCSICREPVISKTNPTSLISPCCGNAFHRLCLQKLSIHSGSYHFKCPVCNNKDIFIN